MAALISDSMALSQTPAEAARPWTRDQCVAQCACLLLRFMRVPNYTACSRSSVCKQFAHGHTRHYIGWDWHTPSPVTWSTP